MIEQAKAILSTVAPTLAAAVGGPFGALAARAITVAVGGGAGKGSSDPEVAARAVLAADPAALAAIRRADREFEAQMAKLGVERERLHAADRASARERQAATGDRTPSWIAGAVLLGFFGVLAALVFVEVPEPARDPLYVMLGALGTLVTQVGSFYFGSSAGSAAKTAALERASGIRREAQ